MRFFVILCRVCIVLLFISNLSAKILPMSPEEKAKKEAQQKQEILETQRKRDQEESIRNNLDAKNNQKQSGTNIPQNKNYNNNNDNYNKQIDFHNNNYKTPSSKSVEKNGTIVGEEEDYNLPSVDASYLSRTKNKSKTRNQTQGLYYNGGETLESFTQYDIDNYNDIVNPYNFKFSRNPAIVILKNDFTTSIDPNISAILYSKAEKSKSVYLPIDKNPNIAMYNLLNSLIYWAPNTIFVSDYDKKSEMIAVKTKSLHYFIIPNNGMISLLKATVGVLDVRKINLYGYMSMFSQSKYAYFYMMAQLATKEIVFLNFGESYPKENLVIDNYIDPKINKSESTISGAIIYNNNNQLITNISKHLIDDFDILIGDSLNIKILKGDKVIYNNKIIYQENIRSVLPEDNYFKLTSFNFLSFVMIKQEIKFSKDLTIIIKKINKNN